MSEASDIRRLGWLPVAACVGVVAVLPKLLWENFNVDGIEAFEFGRSLTSHLFPNWEVHEGVFGFYHNFVLFAYPNHWLITLFGPVEAASRLPFILYLIVLFAALIVLIEHRQKRSLSTGEEAMLWFGLALFSVVQVYNTNYEPFFADIAEMAATDTLWITTFLLACYTLWTGRFAWFWLFALMNYTASPGGLLLLGALTIAAFLARSREWHIELRALGGVVVTCLMLGVLYELFYVRLALGGAKDQFSSVNMLKRLYPPTISEFTRLNALLFPSGLLPAISLVMARRKDPVSWQLALVTILYFGVLYLQAWTSLHQFTPVMLLPLIVFWRFYLDQERRWQRWLLPALGLTTAMVLILSLPRHFQINLAIREFGLATDYRIGNYETGYEQAVRASSSLYALLPEDYRLDYPSQSWGTDPLSWIYYAMRDKPPGTTINYVVQASGETPPPGATLVSSQEGVSVYVFDQEIWERDRQRELPRVVQSALYEPILRDTYRFFRDYVEQLQQQGRVGSAASTGRLATA